MIGARDYYNDFDASAAAWLAQLCADDLIPPGVVDDRSLLDVASVDLAGFRRAHFFAGIGGWAEALRLADWPDWLPVWTGSPPCQPFSPAGKQIGRDDPRHLGPRFVDLVRSARPPMLFGEQVASAETVGRAAKPGKQGAGAEPAWAWIDDLSLRLEAAGYATWSAVVPAASVGAPHIRQRLFFAAVDTQFAGGLADCDGRDARAERQQCGGQHGQQPRDGSVDRLADDKHEQRQVAAGRGDDARGRQQEPAAVAGLCGDRRPGPTNGFWSVADWLHSTDGKWRAVEPGSQPLAHGVSGRVGLLRGYGNAIVPQAAAAFIDASREILIETDIWQALRREFCPTEVAA